MLYRAKAHKPELIGSQCRLWRRVTRLLPLCTKKLTGKLAAPPPWNVQRNTVLMIKLAVLSNARLDVQAPSTHRRTWASTAVSIGTLSQATNRGPATGHVAPTAALVTHRDSRPPWQPLRGGSALGVVAWDAVAPAQPAAAAAARPPRCRAWLGGPAMSPAPSTRARLAESRCPSPAVPRRCQPHSKMGSSTPARCGTARARQTPPPPWPPHAAVAGFV
mmetsp:Transcript_39659/g.118018  ORF Transcript_39659/g.118018 Transcript_39659/m.118018 type:complete len:219 (-) Transcript_39659:118-774(-)